MMASNLRITGLRCEYRIDPIEVDTSSPRPYWLLDSTARGEQQSAFRVLVATDPRRLDSDDGC